MPFRAGEILILEHPGGSPLLSASRAGDRFVAMEDEVPDVVHLIRVRREDNREILGEIDAWVHPNRFRSAGAFPGQAAQPAPEAEPEKFLLICRRQGRQRWDALSQVSTYENVLASARNADFEYHIIPVRSVTHVAVGGQVTDYRDAV